MPVDSPKLVVMGILADSSEPSFVAAARVAQAHINANPVLLPNRTLVLNIITYATHDQIVRGAMKLLFEKGHSYVTGLLVGYFYWDTQAAVSLTKSFQRPSITLSTNSRLIPTMEQGHELIYHDCITDQLLFLSLFDFVQSTERTVDAKVRWCGQPNRRKS